MSPNDALHIAVLAGDGIGPEVMAPAVEVLRRIEAASRLNFRFTEAPAGADHYREAGVSIPESTIRLCDDIIDRFAGLGPVAEVLERELGIKVGESTPDRRIFLKKEEECLAACTGAPMMMVDHVFHEHLTPERLDEILGEMK